MCVFQVEEYKEALDEIMLKGEDGLKIMPELYTVTSDKVNTDQVCLTVHNYTTCVGMANMLKREGTIEICIVSTLVMCGYDTYA